MIRSCNFSINQYAGGYHLESPRFCGYKDIRAMPIIFGDQGLHLVSNIFMGH